MTNKLRFILKPEPYPYPGCKEEIIKWGSISILILEDKESKPRQLFYHQWNINELAEWFAENKRFLNCNDPELEDINLNSLPSESLAKSYKRNGERDFLESEDDLAGELNDLLYTFLERHCLTYAMRGAKIPGVFIGCNHGQGEISLSNKDYDWSYSFDMNEFLEDFQHRLTIFLDS